MGTVMNAHLRNFIYNSDNKGAQSGDCRQFTIVGTTAGRLLANSNGAPSTIQKSKLTAFLTLSSP